MNGLSVIEIHPVIECLQPGARLRNMNGIFAYNRYCGFKVRVA